MRKNESLLLCLIGRSTGELYLVYFERGERSLASKRGEETDCREAIRKGEQAKDSGGGVELFTFFFYQGWLWDCGGGGRRKAERMQKAAALQAVVSQKRRERSRRKDSTRFWEIKKTEGMPPWKITYK